MCSSISTTSVNYHLCANTLLSATNVKLSSLQDFFDPNWPDSTPKIETSRLSLTQTAPCHLILRLIKRMPRYAYIAPSCDTTNQKHSAKVTIAAQSFGTLCLFPLTGALVNVVRSVLHTQHHSLPINLWRYHRPQISSFSFSRPKLEHHHHSRLFLAWRLRQDCLNLNFFYLWWHSAHNFNPHDFPARRHICPRRLSLLSSLQVRRPYHVTCQNTASSLTGGVFKSPKASPPD